MISRLITFYSGLIHGPRYLNKNDFEDFGDFIIMLLILAILNYECHYLFLPGKLLGGSVKNITYFLMAFPILSERHNQILLEFRQIYLPMLLKFFPLSMSPEISDITRKNMQTQIQNYIRIYFEKNFENPNDSLNKYSRFFGILLSMFLKTGLQTYISLYHCGKKTTSSVTKMFVVQHIVKTIFDHLTNKLGENFMSIMEQRVDDFFAQNQGIEQRSMFIAFWMFHKYRENRVFSLYINTLLSTEYLGKKLTIARYDEIMDHADVSYRTIIMDNFHDYEEWLKLHEILRTRLRFSFPIHPKNWKRDPTYMGSWILNTFQNESVVGNFCEKMVRMFQKIQKKD